MIIVKPIFTLFRDSLKPEPGRFALTWRIALLCALMAAFAMLYQIPESAISCYLIIFLMKPDATLNMVLSVALAVIVCFVVIFLFILTDLTINNGLLRMIAIFMSSYVFVFLGAFFKSELGNLIALIIAFLLSMISIAPTGELMTRAILYATLMATSPLLLMFLFNLFLGKRSQTLIIEKLRLRFDNLIAFLSDPTEKTQPEFDQFVSKSSGDCSIHLKLIHVFKLLPEKQIDWLENAVNQSYILLDLCSLLPKASDPDPNITQFKQTLIENCQRLKAGLNSSNYEKNQFEALIQPNAPDQTILMASLLEAQNQFRSPTFLEQPALKQPKISLRQMFQQKRAQRQNKKEPANKEQQKKTPKQKVNTTLCHYFAIKVTLAAITCYCIYNIFDWDGIHTAMITCYVVALSTTAETVHKLILRICGCQVGAAMGVIAIVYILPHLSHVGGLMALVFFGMLIPAWITAGSKLFSYAGVQIGLAFLLTTVHGFSPTVDLSIAQDRILGILLGNVVSYLAFTFLWPISLSEQIEKQLNQGFNLQLSSLNPEHKMPLDLENAKKLRELTTQMEDSLKLTLFEQDQSKLDHQTIQQLRQILLSFNTFNSLCLLPLSPILLTQYKTDLNLLLSRKLMINQTETNQTEINRTKANKTELNKQELISQYAQLMQTYLPLCQNELGKISYD